MWCVSKLTNNNESQHGTAYAHISDITHTTRWYVRKDEKRKPKVRFRFPPEIFNYIVRVLVHKTGAAVGRVNYELCQLGVPKASSGAAHTHTLPIHGVYNVHVFIELNCTHTFEVVLQWTKHVLDTWKLTRFPVAHFWHSHSPENPVWKLMNHRKCAEHWKWTRVHVFRSTVRIRIHSQTKTIR